MDEFMKVFVDWLSKNYPVLLSIIGFIIVFLYILKEIKEIFFIRLHDDETFGKKIYHWIFFWRKRKKVIEPKNIHYSDSDREKIVSKLLIHNFFQAVNNIKTRIPSMDFGDPKKNEVLRDVIRIYVETIEKYACCLIKNYKLDDLNTQQLNKILVEEIEKATYEIYAKMKNKLGDILYQKLIEDPVKGFRARNSIFREIFINGVLLISSQAMSVYNYDNYERASEILTSMYISLQVIVNNFEKVFKDHNGELDELLLH
jgi:hypothetical protein